MRKVIILLVSLLGAFINGAALAQESFVETVRTDYGTINIEYGSHPFDGEFCSVDVWFDDDNTIFSIGDSSIGPYFGIVRVSDDPVFALYREEVTTLMYINNLVREASGTGGAELVGSKFYDFFGTFNSFIAQAQTDALIRFQGLLGTDEFTIPLIVIEDAIEAFEGQCGSLFPWNR